MKNKKNISVKCFLFCLTLLMTGLVACENEDADSISNSPQRLPDITSVSPASGPVRSTVTLTGVNFSENPEDISVTFDGGDPAEVMASTETTITVEVPDFTTSGIVNLVVGTSFAIGGPTFTIELPEIESYSLSTAEPGASVVITGTNFSETPTDNVVSFNGELADVSASTSTSITTTVPTQALTGPITVTVAGNDPVTGSVFTVTRPEVTVASIDPTLGTPGTEVTIAGTGFSEILTNNTVSFQGREADSSIEGEVIAVTTTSITVRVPVGAVTGAISITVFGSASVVGPEFTVTSTTLLVPLTSNDDDVEEIMILQAGSEDAVGDMDLGSSDLEFGEMSSGQGLVKVGLRFNEVNIPQGADVQEASIQFKCDDTGSDPVQVIIFGENIANASPYEEANRNLSGRPLTTANVIWDIPPWVNEGDRTDAQKTVDLSSIIQEIVNRDDWESGNSINIIIEPSGVSLSATSTSGGREAENYSSSRADDGAELSITFN